jgi:hypothetical protein
MADGFGTGKKGKIRKKCKTKDDRRRSSEDNNG